jgi:MFS family permease
MKEMSGTGHLVFFMLISVIVNCDRGATSGFVEMLQEYYRVSSFAGGMLGSGFIGGIMLFAPLAASVKPGWQVTCTIGLGLVVWIISVAVGGLVLSFPVLLAGRCLAGAGEACYAALAPPIIDDTAPPQARAKYMGLYFSSILLGTALGFCVQAPFSSWETGRWVYVVEALLMVPFSLYILFFGARFHRAPKDADNEHVVSRLLGNLSRASLTSMVGGKTPLQRVSLLAKSSEAESQGTAIATAQGLRQSQDSEAVGRPSDGLSQRQSWPSAQERSPNSVKAVLSSPICVCLMCACAAGQFSTGGFGFWAPSYMVEDLKMNKNTAGLLLGAVTAVSGLFGAILGGVLLDVLTRRAEKSLAEQGQVPDQYLRCAIAIKMCGVCGAVAVVAAFIGLQMTNAFGFLALLGVVLGSICMIQAPVNIALMEAVGQDHRCMAMALNNTAMHLLGDLFSPSLIGAIKDASNMNTALIVAAAWLVWCPVLYGAASGLLMCKRRQIAQGLVQST